MRHLTTLLATLMLLAAFAAGARADTVRNVRVHFQPGTSGASLHGHVHGEELVDYKVHVRTGQMMRVNLATRNHSVYFNVYEPGRKPGQDAAFYAGATGGNRVEFRTAHSGDYLVRVFLFRNAARRGEQASYTLDVHVEGAAPHATTAPRQAADAKVPGTVFHATGQIPCARNRGQPMGSCRFGVTREGGGNGWITVFWPDGGQRVIRFEDNTPMRYDESQADGGARMTVGHEADLYHVRIGHQRFEIVEAVMTGG